MRGVLVIAHGSRAKETEAALEAVVAMAETKLSKKRKAGSCARRKAEPGAEPAAESCAEPGVDPAAEMPGRTGICFECAFMEFSDRTIEKGVSALIAKGVTEIIIAPYFLFMGVHMKEDIPDMVAHCAASYPGVKIIMGEPLGVDERLADILADRIMEGQDELFWKNSL